MTPSGTWLASAAVIALTIGVTSRADVPADTSRPLPPGSFIVAADDREAATGQESAQDSAKMGREAGSHKGGKLDTPSESESNKIDQPQHQE